MSTSRRISVAIDKWLSERFVEFDTPIAPDGSVSLRCPPSRRCRSSDPRCFAAVVGAVTGGADLGLGTAAGRSHPVRPGHSAALWELSPI